MGPFARTAIIGAALLTASQPCLAKAAGNNRLVAPVTYDLSSSAPVSASASMSLAASQQAAEEAERRDARRKGVRTSTLLIVGGVLLLVVVVAAAVAGAMPQAGPRKGAFD
jgi:hypothetical protein